MPTLDGVYAGRNAPTTGVRSQVYAGVSMLENSTKMMDGSAAMLRMVKIAIRAQQGHIENLRSRLLAGSSNPLSVVSYTILCLRTRVMNSLYEQHQLLDRIVLRIEQILLDCGDDREVIRGPWQITQEEADMEVELLGTE